MACVSLGQPTSLLHPLPFPPSTLTDSDFHSRVSSTSTLTPWYLRSFVTAQLLLVITPSHFPYFTTVPWNFCSISNNITQIQLSMSFWLFSYSIANSLHEPLYFTALLWILSSSACYRPLCCFFFFFISFSLMLWVSTVLFSHIMTLNYCVRS